MSVRALVIILLLCAVSYGAFTWWVTAGGNPSQPTTVAAPAAPAAQVKNAGYEFIVITEPVKARPAATKPKLKLPPAIAADPTKHVIDATTVPAGERPVTVIPVIDQVTGETQIYTVAEPLPWIDTTQRGDAGLYLGIKRGEPVLRAQARQQLVQVKALKLGALASLDVPLHSRPGGSDLDAFVGLGAWVSW
ncbi:hypothetical protein [Methyloversatilis sp.]|uniref:hypothetical protein n=1 Tax=Methyloversatilis sp. TaxID=2569862 RepID=UPI002735E1BC|nr:hypothetical protein [Methyloversatilis sp.]MDP3579145.1 hypothetical protein [Methyloversatilis sp.]